MRRSKLKATLYALAKLCNHLATTPNHVAPVTLEVSTHAVRSFIQLIVLAMVQPTVFLTVKCGYFHSPRGFGGYNRIVFTICRDAVTGSKLSVFEPGNEVLIGAREE